MPKRKKKNAFKNKNEKFNEEFYYPERIEIRGWKRVTFLNNINPQNEMTYLPGARSPAYK